MPFLSAFPAHFLCAFTHCPSPAATWFSDHLSTTFLGTPLQFAVRADDDVFLDSFKLPRFVAAAELLDLVDSEGPSTLLASNARYVYGFPLRDILFEMVSGALAAESMAAAQIEEVSLCSLQVAHVAEDSVFKAVGLMK